MKHELFVIMTHILETEFMKNTLSTSTSQKSLPDSYKIMIRRFAASPIFVHFDMHYVIFRWIPPISLEYLPFSQTQLRELQTFSPRRGTTRPWEFQLFQDLERISFRQSSFFPVSTFTLRF